MFRLPAETKPIEASRGPEDWDGNWKIRVRFLAAKLLSLFSIKFFIFAKRNLWNSEHHSMCANLADYRWSRERFARPSSPTTSALVSGLVKVSSSSLKIKAAPAILSPFIMAATGPNDFLSGRSRPFVLVLVDQKQYRRYSIPAHFKHTHSHMVYMLTQTHPYNTQHARCAV